MNFGSSDATGGGNAGGGSGAGSAGRTGFSSVCCTMRRHFSSAASPDAVGRTISAPSKGNESCSSADGFGLGRRRGAGAVAGSGCSSSGGLFRALHFVLGALGITLPEAAPAEEAPPEIQALAQRRWEAKQAKDWPAADALRDEIKAAGWIVKDAKDGFELERE